jgi:hypothetical protein
MVGRTSVVGCWILVGVASACSRGALPPRTMALAPIVAAAPGGLDDSALGTPVDAHFHPLQGSIGRSLFPDAPIRRMPQSRVEHDSTVVRDSLTLAANLRAWSFLKASAKRSTERRFGTFRAWQVQGISSIDDTADMDTPPPEAAFYVSKVFWGYSFEAVFEGDRRAFNASVGAQFAIAGGSLSTFAANHRLTASFAGTGLRPRNPDALFARSETDIMQAYDTAGPPSPIFVEYRPVPGNPTPEVFELPLDPVLKVRVRFKEIRVQEGGSWGSTPWFMRVTCTAGGAASRPEWLLQGDRVRDRKTTTLNASFHFIAAPGDVLECKTNGEFRDVVAHGALAAGSSGSVRLEPGAMQPFAIQGRGQVSYEVVGEIDVERVE